MPERQYQRDFNTSHVTVYLLQPFSDPKIKHISIHPMLLFIGKWPQDLVLQMLISIHPMLLFIQRADYNVCPYFDFNTSHVTVYHRPFSAIPQNLQISIHPMLLFIA